jgi:PKD domain/Secretion system C-terminal sorting domain
MRKLYALFTGILISLFVTNSSAQPVPTSICRANFEKLPHSTANDPLLVTYRAIPWHVNGNRPIKICWRFGDGTPDTCITYTNSAAGPYTVTHRYSQPGNYNVCVNILYHGGCEARKCNHIQVGPPTPPACTVRLFEITPSITSLVRGFLAIPHSNTTPPARPYQVCWYFGDGTDTCITFTSSAPPPTQFLMSHTYPAPGTYRACVKVFFAGGCIAQDCRDVVIRSTSNVCGGYMTNELVGPRTFKFKGFGIHPPNDQVISYRWTFGDGTTAFGQEVTHTYANGGAYNVCLNIRTQLGCETRICKTVHLPGQNAPQLHLSPNPVINVMNVSFFSTHTESINIRILNNNGIVVRNFSRNVTTGANNWSHDLSNLLPGLYSYVVQSPNQLASAIFIKQ